MKNELKPCPFCGQTPKLCGEKSRGYVNGKWEKSGYESFWIKPRCLPNCVFGNTHARAFTVIDGLRYSSPEAAAQAWNRREKE